jgi:hypothetical protein
MLRHTTLESVVKNLLKELPEKAEDVEVQIFLDGMSAYKLEVVVEGKSYPVRFVMTSSDNMPGWVRLVYGIGVLE